MKIEIMFKDTDTLLECIETAVTEQLDPSNLSEDEAKILIETRIQKANKICGKWFEGGEYLMVEVDTEKDTCTVIPVKDKLL